MLLQSVGHIVDVFHSCVASIGDHFAGPAHRQIIALVHSIFAQSCLMLPVIVQVRICILTCLIAIATPLR